MASNVREDCGDIEKQMNYVRRLVYDVLVYTLPRCGFPEEDLPPTDCRENVYNRSNFVELAGLSALRISLVLRDKWMYMFSAQHKSLGFTKENTPLFLRQVVLTIPLSWTDTTQSVVEAFLAICGEIILFFYHEGINIDLDIVLNSVSAYITSFVSAYPNVPEKIEELVGKIYDVPGYREWLTSFIESFAIPYGSIEGISSYFLTYVTQQFKDFLQMSDISESLTLTDVRDYLGFLTEEAFSNIVYGNTYENLESSPEFISISFDLPIEPRKSSESSAVEDEESQGECWNKSTDSSEETAQGAECSKESSETKIEDEFKQMSLGTEGVSQAIHGAIPKRRTSKKKN